MKVSELMTKNPATAMPTSGLSEVAKMMRDCDCGAIPVVENDKVVGVITDRDITIRVVAENKNVQDVKVSDVMSKQVYTAKENDDVRDVANQMEKHKVRRVPVVDDQGKCIGIVSQADIALNTTDRTTADLVQKVSEPGKK